MLLCLMYPHTKQMLPYSWYSACWRTGSPATSNKDLQVRFLKTQQLQTCSLIAWRKVCSEDLILQCPDCPQLFFMFLCLQRGCQWYYWIWVWQWQLMLKMTQAMAGKAGHFTFLLPQSPFLCIYVASLNVSLQLFLLFTMLRTQVPRDSHFSTWVRVQVPAVLESFPCATWLYSAIIVDSTLSSWTSSSLCVRSDHRVYCPQCCREGNKKKRLHGNRESDIRSTHWISRDVQLGDPIRIQEVTSPSHSLKLTGTRGPLWSLFHQRKWNSYASHNKSAEDLRH